jgi:hypothetical protein
MRSRCLAPVLLFLLATAAGAAPLRVVAYNTHGLPPIPPIIPDVSAQIALIAPKLEQLHADGTPTVLALQEVFYEPYYTTLTDPNVVSYPDVTVKDNGGPNLIGDGLTLMSDPPLSAFTRTQWNQCFGTGLSGGADCDTNKGFTFARITLAPGVEVDLYSLHADASNDVDSQAARRDNILQLVAAINATSVGRAVVVLGDTNSRYTRSTDNIGLLLTDAGLKDAWVESALGGVAPSFGPNSINGGCPPPRGNAVGAAVDAAGPTCELVDKIFFRSGDTVQISLTSYEVPLDFVDGASQPLSDHLPVLALLDVQLVPEPELALLLVAAGFVLRVARRRG